MGLRERNERVSLSCFLLPFEGICFLTAADDVPPFSTPALAFFPQAFRFGQMRSQGVEEKL